MEKNIKDEFISTLSHEIRTPLTSIKGFCQTMLNSWDLLDDNKKKEFLEIILNQSKRLINLVENVLNVAKIDSNSNDLILSKVEINKLVQNCANMLKIANPDFIFEFIYQQTPCASIASATFIKPAILAPATRLPSMPNSFAALTELS